MIYKMFDGRHIDLSRVVAIGPTESEYGFDGWFHVWFQLMDHPLTWTKGQPKSGEFGKPDAAAHNARIHRFEEEFYGGHSAVLEAWSALVNERGVDVQQN